MAAALGDSLLAKGCMCAVSVVKADRVPGGVATNRVRREVSISVAINALFGNCTFGKMILQDIFSTNKKD